MVVRKDRRILLDFFNFVGDGSWESSTDDRAESLADFLRSR